MRNAGLALAFIWALLGLSGCDMSGSSQSSGGGLVASAPQTVEQAGQTGAGSPFSETAPSAPAPLSDAVAAAPASPGGAMAAGAMFDGSAPGAGSPEAPPTDGAVVAAPAMNGGAMPVAAYTKPAPKVTLKINAPPPPVNAAVAGDTALASFAPNADQTVQGPDGDATAGPLVLPPDSPGCPAGMAALPGFCIDRFEAPNVPGAHPLAAQTALEAEAWCSSRGKRLCTEDEWTRACAGAANRSYPYDGAYKYGRCNDNAVETMGPSPNINWGLLNGNKASGMQYAATLYKALPSGSKRACATPEGVYDLMGNVTEWTVSRAGRQWPHVMKGGFWYGAYHTWAPTCGFTNPAHNDTFRSYEAGFRCCTSS